MNIALIGYGRMGKEIEKIAISRGHKIKLTIDVDNKEDLNTKNLKDVDVAIEFTLPSTAVDNYNKCMEAKVPIVSGTTGWLEKCDEIKEKCNNEGNAFFYASNFSLGVNLFFKLNEELAKLMNKFNEYDVSVEEVHHTKKLDAPSGTAITVAEGILNNIERKKSWELEKLPSDDNLRIDSVRRGNVPGIHTVYYDSEVDYIEITHSAKSRQGFALGAVLAAEYMKDKTSGWHGMSNLLGI